MSVSGVREKRSRQDDGATRSGLWAVFMGLLGLLTAFVVVSIHWNDESGVAALGAVASTIAGILSAYFGIQYTQRTGGDMTGTVKKRKGD